VKHAWLMLLAACASQPTPEPTTAPATDGVPAESPTDDTATSESALLGAWQQDHAQSADGVEVFVRGDLELPPARFRQRWTFEAGGVLRASTLAANDAHGEGEGRWRLEGERLVLEMPDEAPQVWVIVEVGETLRVRPAE